MNNARECAHDPHHHHVARHPDTARHAYREISSGAAMSRNFGIPNMTRRPASGEQPLTASHYAPDTQRNRNSLADHSPPGRLHLAVVRGSPFTTERKLHPIEPLHPRVDHREFAALIFAGIFFGLVITAATVVMALT